MFRGTLVALLVYAIIFALVISQFYEPRPDESIPAYFPGDTTTVTFEIPARVATVITTLPSDSFAVPSHVMKESWTLSTIIPADTVAIISDSYEDMRPSDDEEDWVAAAAAAITGHAVIPEKRIEVTVGHPFETVTNWITREAKESFTTITVPADTIKAQLIRRESKAQAMPTQTLSNEAHRYAIEIALIGVIGAVLAAILGGACTAIVAAWFAKRKMSEKEARKEEVILVLLSRD